MRKRTCVIVAVFLMAVQSVMGQIIYTQEDVGTNLRANGDPENFGVMVPLQNSNLDQYQEEYVPLSDGLLLLAGLGGAYLLKKKKK